MASYGYYDNGELFRGSDFRPQEDVCDTDLFPFRTSCQQSDQSLRDPRTFSNDRRVINEPVSPKFENEQRADKGGNTVSDYIAVGHFPLIRRVAVERAKGGFTARESKCSKGGWASLHAKLNVHLLLQRRIYFNTGGERS